MRHSQKNNQASVRYLTITNMLLIHSMLIDEIGGLHGIREHSILAGLENAPKQHVFGKELYPTLHDKAAVYARTIIQNHPFLDGNKRTGMTAAFVFLKNNGYKSTAERGEIEKGALEIIEKRLDIEAIASWLKHHSKPIKNT
ncbi:MAG: type II toxin-antitoxin system death-on-curing family toxin [Parcubacteria group bacterium]|nr:type II toxin-antitoxin system death-on-curing family toxin [Parcubacteria group bacterium]